MEIPEGFLHEWCSVLSQGTEMPPEAYLATGLVTVSAIVGPRFVMRWSPTRQERANIWVLNCGRSALARKTTGQSAASWAARVAREELGDQVRYYNAKRLSAAGLANDLDVLGQDSVAAQRDEDVIAEAEKRKPRKVEAQPRPMPVAWMMSVNEIAPLWGEQGAEWQRETSGMLLDLFDGELVSRTRSTSVAAQETFVCAIGNIPPAVLAERTSLVTLTSGFAGRWLVMPSPGPVSAIPTPRLNGTNPLAGLAEVIHHLARMAREVRQPIDLVACLPEDGPGDRVRDEWYRAQQAAHLKADPEDMMACARADLWVRLQATALKLAVLLAIARNAGRLDRLEDVEIEAEDVEWAQKVCERSLETLTEVVTEGGGGTTSPLGKVENRVIAYLRRRDATSKESGVTLTAVSGSAKGSGASRRDVIAAVEALIATEALAYEETGIGRNGRTVWLV